jgi:hypothetical protein
MSLVLFAPITDLRTTLAPLRGEHTEPRTELAPMPLRVARAPDGGLEVVDGFKRLSLWHCHESSDSVLQRHEEDFRSHGRGSCGGLAHRR